MTLLERMLEKFSPPLDSSLIVSLCSELPDSIESELALLETLSDLIQETHPPEIQPQSQSTHSDSPTQPLIQQVQSIFPNLSESLIERAISNNASQDLNDIIDFVQAAEYEVQCQASATSRDLPSSSQSPTRSIKKNKKPLTIHLNDVLQRETATRFKQFRQAQAPHHIDNAWVTGDSQIIYLSNLLGIETSKIYSTYHSKACNLVLTLEEICSRLESSKRIDVMECPEKLDQLSIQLDFLRTMLSGNDDETLTRLLILTDLDPGNAYDLWLFLDDLQHRYGTLPFNQFFFSHSNSHHRCPSNLVDRKTQSSSNNQTTLKNEPIDERKWTPVSHSTKGIPGHTSVHSMSHCSTKLNELENHYEKVNQLLRNPRPVVGQSSSGNNSVHINKRAVQSSIALIRGEEAGRLLNQVKEWELELAKVKVNDRQRACNNFNSIDLHGLTRNQASFIASQHLNSWWNRVKHLANAYNSEYEPFRIITGAGTHSEDLKPILLRTITCLLDEGRWKWKFEEKGNGAAVGSLIVYGIKKSG